MEFQIFNYREAMIYRLRLLIIFIAFLPGSLLAEDTKQTLVLGTTLVTPLSTPSKDGYVDLIAKEAFNRIGINVISQRLPSERSLRDANAGNIDGELLRVGNIHKLYTNLIKVPETIMTLDFVAFTNTTALEATNWKAIQPLSIGLIRGWKIFEINTRNANHVTKVKNPTLLFNLLKKDRADIVLYERFEGLSKVKALGLSNAHILEPALASKEMFMFLHKKHSKLVPLLAAEIKAMKKDGTFDRLRAATLTDITPANHQ